MSALESVLRQPVTLRLGWTLAHFLWQGTLIAAAYAAARGIGGRFLSARGRYAMACAALAAMMAAPPATFMLASFAAAAPAGWALTAGPAWERALPWLVVIWVAGVTFFSVRLIRGWRVALRLRRVAVAAVPTEWSEALNALMARMRVSAPVRLIASSLAATPAVVGYLKPVILVPVEMLTGLPAEQLRALLAHELAHIVRRDYLVNFLQSVAEAALFYHPAVWWVSERIRAEREACCDDLAVEVTGNALAYASALAGLESGRRERLEMANAANGGSLVSRIHRLAGRPESVSHTLPGAAAAWAMSLLWLAGAGAALAGGAHTSPGAAHRAFIAPEMAAAAPAAIALPAPPRVRLSAANLSRALLFDPFFAAPMQQAALPDAVKQLGSISGVVTTTSGTAIAKAQVSLLPSSSGTPIAAALSVVYQAPSPRMQSRSVATGDDGAFAFDMLTPGSYRLMVTHPSYLDTGGLGLGAGPSSARAPVPVAAGQRVEDVRIELVEPGTVSGRVVDEDDDPVAQAAIDVTRFVYSDGKRRLSATAGTSSNDNGDFKITRIPPGTYIVKTRTLPSGLNARTPIPAAKPGHLYNPNETYYGDTRIAGDAAPVKVDAGQNVALGVIRMRNRALPTVRGKVTGDLSLLADAHVGFLLPDVGGGGIPSRYIADIQKDGSYAVANLWESAAGDAVTIGVESRKLGLLAFTTIAVRAEGEEGVVLNVAAAPLSGSVRMEDDPAAPQGSALQPLPPMQVRLRALGQVAVITSTAAVKPDGSFAIPLLAAGLYAAEVSGLPTGSYVKSVKLNGKESREQGVDWAGPGSGPLEVLISRRAAVLDGTVKDADGNPVSGTVTLVPVPPRPGHPSLYPTATADEHGFFGFGALTPGTYQVYAWEEIEPTAHWDPRFMDRFATRAETVEVGESGHATVSLKRTTAAEEREVLRNLHI